MNLFKVVEEEVIEMNEVQPAGDEIVETLPLVDSEIDEDDESIGVAEVMPAPVDEEVDYSFDSNDIIKGFDNDSNEPEGGIERNKTIKLSGSIDNEGSAGNSATVKYSEDMVNLSGFGILVKEGVENVNIEVSDIETAKACINGRKYMYVSNGVMTSASIVTGTPVISNTEIEICKLLEGKWVK